MSKQMKENHIVDTMNYQIPDDLKTTVSELKDFDSVNKYLEIEIDATHGGYVNSNFYRYTIDGQAQGAASFIIPYQKPVLEQHLSDSTPIGRIVASAFIPLVTDEDDLKSPKSKIRLKAVITDQKAIENILTKRYFTVSTGGSAKQPPKCNICKEPVASIGPLGAVSGCDHRRGQSYEVEDKEGKQLCWWDIGEMEYKEVSFVNMPADQTPKHVASVVSVKWTDNIDPQDSVTMDASSTIKDFQVEKKVEKKPDEKPKEEKSELKKNKPKEKVEDEEKNKKGGEEMADKKNLWDQILTSLAILADCEECEENPTEEWTNEAEVKSAEELDGEFTEIMNQILEEDKKLPPAGSKARQAMKTKFCGPNKTFPIPDCKHAAVALAMVNWPKVKAKYSASVRARIVSCVRSRANTLGCKMAKKDSDEILNKIKDLEKQNADFKTKVQEIESQLQEANKKISDMSQDLKIKLAEKVVDLAIMAKRSIIIDVVQAENEEQKLKAYNAHVEEFSERSEESLKDSIEDLNKEAGYVFKVDEKITDPNLSDEINIKSKGKKVKKEDEDKKRQKRVSSLVFGINEEE